MSYAEVVTVLIAIVGLAISWVRLVKPPARRQTLHGQIEAFDLQALVPYPLKPFKQSRTYHMTMGLQKLDLENWLTVDKSYIFQHGIRADILTEKRDAVFRYLAGSEDACAELLERVVNFLTKKYPAMFKVSDSMEKDRTITNAETGEVFELTPPFNGAAPLEIVARLVSEDFNILKKDDQTGEHYL